MRPISEAPKDGTMFLALDLGYYPAFVRYCRPYGARKRWFIVASQGAVFTVDDLAERQITQWMTLPQELRDANA